jgi:DNA-binding transcriptional regulator WhiA
MSFTAEVKDELARVAGPEPGCDVAALSALVHVAGSLNVRSGRYAIRLVTETGARVLGKPIPKTVKEIEETMAQ